MKEICLVYFEKLEAALMVVVEGDGRYQGQLITRRAKFAIGKRTKKEVLDALRSIDGRDRVSDIVGKASSGAKCDKMTAKTTRWILKSCAQKRSGMLKRQPKIPASTRKRLRRRAKA